MEKKKKRRRHRGLGFLILVMGVLIVCGVYQYREYGNIKDVMLKLIGQDPVIYQHVSEEIGEMDGKFYYQQLSEEEQTVYQELLQGLLEHVEQIHVHSQKPERVNELLVYVLNDYPEIFWSDGTASSTAYSGLQNYTSVMPGYLYTKEECEKKKTQIDMEVSECLSGISENASDYEKILYNYEYIVNQVDYDDAGTLGLITVYNDMSSKLKEKLAEYNLKYLIIQSVPLCVCAYKKSLLAQNAYLTNEMLQKTPVTGFWFDAHLFDDNPRNITFAFNDYEQQKNIMKSKNAYGWYSKNELAHILGADYTALESDKKVKMQYILIYRELDETLLNKLLELLNKSEIF